MSPLPHISLSRLKALCVKESHQILRDPSSIVIAFILPLMLMLIFGYGVNMDSGSLRIGLVLEDQGPQARRFADMFRASTYIEARVGTERGEMTELMQAGKMRGIVVVPADFTRRLMEVGGEAPLQVITDGSEPNTANFVHGYVTGVWQLWLQESAQDMGYSERDVRPLFDAQVRFWFNQAAVSRNFIMPGAITIILMVVGAILTSLVIAREWERGTMEALLSTRITRGELLLSKIIPYFFIGMGTQIFCLLFAIIVFEVPFRGSFWVFLVVGSLFMFNALGQGLLMSTIMRNQFNAAQLTLVGAFLPAVMLSGFVFEIDSMPMVVRGITYILPPRYYVSAMHTMCLAGNIPFILGLNSIFLLVLAAFFLYAHGRKDEIEAGLMLHRIITLIIKELLMIMRSPQSRMIVIMPVIMQVAIFPFAATLDVQNATIGIYNDDAGEYSLEITQRLAMGSSFSRVVLIHDDEAMARAVNNQRVLLVVRFPADFSRNVISGGSAPMQVILDGRRSNAGQVALNYVQNILMQYQAELMEQAGKNQSLNTSLEFRNWYNPNLNYKWFVLPSLVALITTIGVMIFTALSVAREREQGTMDQLLVSPLSTGEIFVGKAVPAVIVATLQGSMVLIGAVVFYRIPFAGSVILFYINILLYGFSLVGVGLLISAICSTQQQALIGVFLFLMPAIILSGYLTPIENMSESLQYITLVNPVRHFTEITKQIYLKDADFQVLWQSMWPLILIAAFSTAFAYGFFRRKLN